MTITGYYSTKIGLEQELGDDGVLVQLGVRGLHASGASARLIVRLDRRRHYSVTSALPPRHSERFFALHPLIVTPPQHGCGNVSSDSIALHRIRGVSC